MNFLRQSTAVDIAIGPFVDATDGVTAETGLTIAQADVRLKKNAGAWAQVNDNTSATHEEAGWYEKELDATDTNTVGILLVSVQESGALPVWHSFQVLEEAVYDALFAASAAGYGTAQTGDSFARLGAPAGASHAADNAAIKVDTAAILVDTGTTLDGRIPAALVGGRMDCTIDGTGMEAGAVTAVQNGLATAAELAKVPKSDGTASWNATALAAINAQADTALADYDGPTNAEMTARTLATADYATAAAQTTAQGTIDKLDDTLEDDGGTFRFTANALEEAPAGGGGGGDATEAKQDTIIALIGTPAVTLADDIAALPTNAELGTALDPLPTAAENATAVWGAGTRVLTAGTNIALAKGTGVTGFNDLSAAQVNAEVDTGIADAALATATALATVDGNVDAVKTQTDQLTFGASGVDANIVSVIDDPVQESGSTATNWGGAP